MQSSNGGQTSTKKLLKYLKYSGASIILKINPMQWRVGTQKHSEDIWDANSYIFHLDLGPITFRLWIDNGDW